MLISVGLYIFLSFEQTNETTVCQIKKTEFC